MKLLVWSDLHLDHHPAARAAELGAYAARSDADLLLVAGDVADGPHALDALAPLLPAGLPVLYVPGNHEFYAPAPGWTHARIRAHLRARAAALGVTLLDDSAVRIGGVRFLGATLWTDFALFGEPAPAQAAATACMPDYRCIRVGRRRLHASDTVRWHRRSRAWLAGRLARAQPGPTVVLTHHAPHPASLEPRYADDPVSAAFASDLGACLDGARVVLWIHGHSHCACDYTVGGTRVVANPHGYPRERPGFAGDFTVTV